MRKMGPIQNKRPITYYNYNKICTVCKYKLIHFFSVCKYRN